MNKAERAGPNWELISTEIVEKLEAIHLDSRQKAEILYVLAKLKPAAWISFQSKAFEEGKENDPEIFYSDEEIEEYYIFLKSLNLPFHIFPKENKIENHKVGGLKKQFKFENVSTILAQSQESLAEVSKAAADKNHRALGLALGYPERAVNAFINKTGVNLYSLPKDVLASDAFIFSHTLTFSNDQWEEEIKHGERNAEFLKSISPKIYDEVRQKAMILYESMGVLDDNVRAKWMHKHS
jgi:hypothetical protein